MVKLIYIEDSEKGKVYINPEQIVSIEKYLDYFSEVSYYISLSDSTNMIIKEQEFEKLASEGNVVLK